MNNSLFFPPLKRQKLSNYHNQNNTFYADYLKNYEKVKEDCQERCVYCDAIEDECGGDNFSLDHYRPKKIFVNKFNGILIKHPYNLYLSCQKCNVLKTSDWHGCKNYSNGYTYLGNQGYIDRFRHNTRDFLKVSDNGDIIALKDPISYMVKKLCLNRPNRSYIRLFRMYEAKKSRLENIVGMCIDNIIDKSLNGSLDPVDALRQIEYIRKIQAKLSAL
ncbi:hypothetical protein AB6D24_02790 [Vibrio splendidus]